MRWRPGEVELSLWRAWGRGQGARVCLLTYVPGLDLGPEIYDDENDGILGSESD